MEKAVLDSSHRRVDYLTHCRQFVLQLLEHKELTYQLTFITEDSMRETQQQTQSQERERQRRHNKLAVSYTHLTLPTILRV